MIHYEFSILIAVSAFVYSYLLTRPGKLLNGFYNRADVFFKTDARQSKGKGPHWAFMLLINCEQCIAGQLALWLYVILCPTPKLEFIAIFMQVLKLIFFVAHTILAAAVIKGVYTRYID